MIYYGDSLFPLPTFKRSLPGAIGYSSPCGTIVYYGHAPEFNTVREEGAAIEQALKDARPFRQDRDGGITPSANPDPIQKRIAEILKMPTRTPDGSELPPKKKLPHPEIWTADPIEHRTESDEPRFANHPKGTKNTHRVCASCGEVPDEITRHHIIPRAVGSDSRTIKLCPECHFEIHRLPNRHIAKMPATQQIDFINRTRPRTGNFPIPPKIILDPVAEPKKPNGEKRPTPKDPVLANMMKAASLRRIKKNVDHKNRHHGSNF